MIFWPVILLTALNALTLPVYALMSGVNSRRILHKLFFLLIASIYPCAILCPALLTITLLSTEPYWDALLCFAAFGIVELAMLLTVMNQIRKRSAWIPLLCMTVCFSGAVAWSGVQRIHDAGIPTFRESVVVRADYDPAREGNLLAVPDKPASLTLPPEGLPYLNGSSALYPLYAAAAHAVYPPEAFDPSDSTPVFSTDYLLSLFAPTLLECSATGGAYRALTDGRADVIFVSGPSDDQLLYAAEKGQELVFTPIALDSLTFFVNAVNPVHSLTSGQLRDIYSGAVTDWSALGGASGRIRAYQHDKNSGSQSALTRFMEGIPTAPAPGIRVLADRLGIIQSAADYKNYETSIGFTFLFNASKMVAGGQIRLLSVDGIEPTHENIRSGDYPLVQPLYAVTLASNENPSVALFIDWLLSPEGQALIEKTGYVALN